MGEGYLNSLRVLFEFSILFFRDVIRTHPKIQLDETKKFAKFDVFNVRNNMQEEDWSPENVDGKNLWDGEGVGTHYYQYYFEGSLDPLWMYGLVEELETLKLTKK